MVDPEAFHALQGRIEAFQIVDAETTGAMVSDGRITTDIGKSDRKIQKPEGYCVGELMVDSTLVSDTVSFDRWANQAGTGIIANMRAGNITSVHTQNIWRHRGATLDIARGPNVLFADGHCEQRVDLTNPDLTPDNFSYAN